MSYKFNQMLTTESDNKSQSHGSGQSGSPSEAWTVEELEQTLERVEGAFPLDGAVIEVLPRYTEILSAESCGTSEWTKIARISTIQPNGSPKEYFLKCAHEIHGRTMMLGEFTSVSEIEKIMPGLVPAPYAWGQYKRGDPSTFFYFSQFVHMDTVSAPDPIQFTAKVAELHKKSISPNGKFGFDVTTCDGKIAHIVEWEDSWATFYAKLLSGVAKLDLEANGSHQKLQAATANIIEKVIPRLLGALQSEGREIKPSLIHGDLWEGNVAANLETGAVVLFDAGSYYAHNEMDLGIWRSAIGQHFHAKAYTHNYLRNYPAAEPVEEFDDRNRLYSLKYKLNYSAGHPGSAIRESAYNDMCYLSALYSPLEGLDEYNPQKDPSVTGLRIVAHAD